MNVTRANKAESKRGPAEWFMGTVWLQELSGAASGSHLRVFRVSFEPGARTAWHTHPHGQLLHIVAGIARVQKAGEPAIEVQPGDSVWIEPGERHWHGAAPNCAMVHIAAQIADENGNAATWFEHVSEADYG